MSEIRSTKCDGCGVVFPEEPEELFGRVREGWTQVIGYFDNDIETRDYCKECSARMLKAVE